MTTAWCIRFFYECVVCVCLTFALIEQVKKTKFEMELIKIVDCFLDGHGNYTSNLMIFKVKSL